MFYVLDKNTGEQVFANGFWAIDQDGQLFDVIDGWGCEGGGGSSEAPSNFLAVFGEAPHAEPRLVVVQFACDMCGKKFKAKSSLNDHRSMKHFAGINAATQAPYKSNGSEED